MRPRFDLTRRPLLDLALVVAVVGLLVAAYAIADWPWPVEFVPLPVAAVETVVTAPARPGTSAVTLTGAATPHRSAMVPALESGRT